MVIPAIPIVPVLMMYAVHVPQGRLITLSAGEPYGYLLTKRKALVVASVTDFLVSLQ